MRKQFCDALVTRSAKAEMVFLTGDLGFMALEALEEALGPRFINAGVAEQNMFRWRPGLRGRILKFGCIALRHFVMRGHLSKFEMILPSITCRSSWWVMEVDMDMV